MSSGGGEKKSVKRVQNPLLGASLPKSLSRSSSLAAVGADEAAEPEKESPLLSKTRPKRKGTRRKLKSSAAAPTVSPRPASTPQQEDDTPSPSEILEQMVDPVKGVRLGTHKKMLKTYRRCFPGREGIDWLVAKYKISREKALLICRALLEKNEIAHVTASRQYEDSDQLYVFKGQNATTGLLTVVVKEAAGLREGKGGDVYCKVFVKYKASEVTANSPHGWKTPSAKRPQPKWNALFKLPMRAPPDALQLQISVFSRSRVGSNDFLGHLDIPLDPLNHTEAYQEWFPLQKRRHGEEVRGEVLLELQYVDLTKSSAASEALDIGADAPLEEEQEEDELSNVQVEEPDEMLAEIPYDFDNPRFDSDIIIAPNAEGRIRVKAASPVKLVEHLTSKEAQDVDLMDNIILAYRTFIAPLDLLNLFLLRYRGPPPGGEGETYEAQVKAYEANKEDIQNRVGTFLARWISKSSDFSFDPVLMLYLKKLIDVNFFESTSSLQKYFGKKYEECVKERKLRQGGSSAADGHQPASVATMRRETLRDRAKTGSSMLSVGAKLLLDLNTDEIAEQLTLIEHQLFKSIQPHELLNQNWNKHQELAPNILEYIAWFNKMCQWAATEIIKQDEPESRAVIISKFIRIAARLRELHNYNGVMEILASLEGSAVRRLKQSWTILPAADVEKLEELADLMKPAKNFKEYREATASADKPWIPYLGLHLTDLTFADDGNDSKVQGTLTNLDKVLLTARCARQVVESVVGEYYNIRPMMSIQKLLLAVPNQVFDDNEVYRLSLMREARGKDLTAGRGNKSRLANIAKNMMKRSNVKAEKELTDEDWDILLNDAKVVTFEKDEVIIKQGALNRFLYKIRDGTVRVEKVVDGNEAEPLLLTTMEPPRVFGEMSIIMYDNRPSVSCVANEAGTALYQADYLSLHRSFERYPDLAKRFYMTMAKKLSETLVKLVPKKDNNSNNNNKQANAAEEEEEDDEESAASSSAAAAEAASPARSRSRSASVSGEPGTPRRRRKKVKKKKKRKKRNESSSSSIVPAIAASSVSQNSNTATEEGDTQSATGGDISSAESEEHTKDDAVQEDSSASHDASGSLNIEAVRKIAGTQLALDGVAQKSPRSGTSSNPRTPRKVRVKKKVRRRRKKTTVRPTTRPPAPTASPETKKNDAERYRTVFDLAAEEELVSQFDASLKRYEGKLVLFEKHACFLSEMFMNTQKKVFPLSRVQKVSRNGDSISLQTASSDVNMSFTTTELATQAFEALEKLWGSVAREEGPESGEGEAKGEGGAQKEGAAAVDVERSLKDRKILSDADWDLILNGAKRITYTDGEYIIKAGENYQKIYHIVKGTCGVNVDRNGEQVTINVMPENTTFGEMSFIKQTEDSQYQASASVVARGEVEVSIIEGYFISILFDMHPHLEAKFFEYLCDVLAVRINKQTQKFGAGK